MSENKNLQKANPAPEAESIYLPRVDIRESVDQYVVVADVPGADEKTVEATVQNQVLTLEAWAAAEKPAQEEMLAQEFVRGRYRRDFTLPEDVDATRIQARVKNGVLTVLIPKKEEVKPRRIQISSGD